MKAENEEIVVVEEEVVEEIVEVEEVSPEIQAIIDEAEAIEAKLYAEQAEIYRTVTANMVARFNLAKKTGINLKRLTEMGSEIGEMSFDEGDLGTIENKLYDFSVALLGDKLASEYLDKFDDQKFGFLKPITDLFTATSVKKA